MQLNVTFTSLGYGFCKPRFSRLLSILSLTFCSNEKVLVAQNITVECFFSNLMNPTSSCLLFILL